MQFTGLMENNLAIRFHVLAELNRLVNVIHHLRQNRLAIDQRKPPQIVSIQVQQIERKVRERLSRSVLKRSLKVGKAGIAVFVQYHRFAVEDSAFYGNVLKALRDRPHAMRPVQPCAGKQTNTRPVFSHLDTIPIQLQLMQPSRSFRGIVRRQRQLRRHKRRHGLRRGLADRRR